MHFILVLTCINCNKSVIYVLFLIFSRRLWRPGSIQDEQSIELKAKCPDKIQKNIPVDKRSDFIYFNFGVLTQCVDVENTKSHNI